MLSTCLMHVAILFSIFSSLQFGNFCFVLSVEYVFKFMCWNVWIVWEWETGRRVWMIFVLLIFFVSLRCNVGTYRHPVHGISFAAAYCRAPWCTTIRKTRISLNGPSWKRRFAHMMIKERNRVKPYVVNWKQNARGPSPAHSFCLCLSLSLALARTRSVHKKENMYYGFMGFYYYWYKKWNGK